MRPVLRCLSDRNFRANPAFLLVEQGGLPADLAPAFRGLAEDASHYGVLLPKGGEGPYGVLAVDRDTAHLFSMLQEPGPLPAHATRGAPARVGPRLARLVLDGVLEVEGDDGFVSSWNARSLVFAGPTATGEPEHVLSRLSREALRRAQLLPLDEPRTLSHWLYAFGRIPSGPRWARLLGGAGRIDGFLGLDDRAGLGGRFQELYERSRVGPWCSWRLREPAARNDPTGDAEGSDAPPFKVYVSPTPHTLRRALRSVAEVLVERPAPGLKLGATLPGILRPDKLMVYFHDIEDLRAFVSALAPGLEGCGAHGVPFTAPLDEEGLLSWGVDPPAGDRIPGWRGRRSWRLWITDRIARALVAAGRLAPGDDRAWLFALERLSLDGVDGDDWLPPGEGWSGQGEGT